MSGICKMPGCQNPVRGIYEYCSGLCKVNHRRLLDPDFTEMNSWDDEDSANPRVAALAKRKREALGKPRDAVIRSRRKAYGKRRRPHVDASGVRFCVHCKDTPIAKTAGNSALYCSAACRRKSINARSREKYAEGTRRTTQ